MEMVINKKLNKCILCFALVVSMIASLTGCGGIELTDEESHKIAEYSAGLLLKHNKGYSGSLTNAEYTPPKDIVSVNTEPEVITPEEEQPVIDENVSDESGLGNGSSSGELLDNYFSGTLADAIGLQGFDISYTGWEMTDIYPKDEVGELVFSMQSQPGKKLLVLHFNLTNLSGDDALCDMLHNDAKLRLYVNGEKRINSQSTIISNDLKQYCESIPGGTTIDSILVFEATDEVCANIMNMDLLVSKDGQKNKIKLF